MGREERNVKLSVQQPKPPKERERRVRLGDKGRRKRKSKGKHQSDYFATTMVERFQVRYDGQGEREENIARGAREKKLSRERFGTKIERVWSRKKERGRTVRSAPPNTPPWPEVKTQSGAVTGLNRTGRKGKQ